MGRHRATVKPERIGAAGLAVNSTTGQVHVVGSFSGSLNTNPDPDPLNPELTSAADAWELFWVTFGQS